MHIQVTLINQEERRSSEVPWDAWILSEDVYDGWGMAGTGKTWYTCGYTWQQEVRAKRWWKFWRSGYEILLPTTKVNTRSSSCHCHDWADEWAKRVPVKHLGIRKIGKSLLCMPMKNQKLLRY